jgi:hypothetical protein
LPLLFPLPLPFLVEVGKERVYVVAGVLIGFLFILFDDVGEVEVEVEVEGDEDAVEGWMRGKEGYRKRVTRMEARSW